MKKLYGQVVSSFLLLSFLSLPVRANDNTEAGTEVTRSEQSCENLSVAELQERSEKLALQQKIAEAELAIQKALAGKTLVELEVNKKRYETASAQMDAITKQEKLAQEEQFMQRFSVQDGPQYLEQPYLEESKTLVISDRRIPMNGPIVDDTASYVEKRIAFYNLQDQKMPIFIVISNSPGGSVVAGMRILQAMRQSKVPVYVVVKSFAASMAAVITTLAERSFAYPVALILHHQLSSGGRGNTTDMIEMVNSMQAWQRRLLEPVATKMGITLVELVNQMYDHSRSGDWEEFADGAQKLKWLDTIPERVIETALQYHPDISTDPRMLDSDLSRVQGQSTRAPLSVEADYERALRENLHLYESIRIVRGAEGKYHAVLPPVTNMGPDVYAIFNPKGFFKEIQ